MVLGVCVCRPVIGTLFEVILHIHHVKRVDGMKEIVM